MAEILGVNLKTIANFMDAAQPVNKAFAKTNEDRRKVEVT